MPNDFSLHEVRLNRQYDPRIRRALERFSGLVGGYGDRLDTIEAGGTYTIDYDHFNIDGVTGESVDIPTAGGQWLIRTSNKVDGAGTHTLTFNTNNALVAAAGTKATIATTAAGSVLMATSVYYDDLWRWYLYNYLGWA